MGKTPDKNKVLVALSGGVDSAAAAVLLRRAGMDVTGVYICMQKDSPEKLHGRACCSPQDAADAGKIASRLGINFTVLDANEAFENIKDEFASSYEHGRTPNPCIVCNQRIKFGKLFDLADSMGVHYVVTGHYAKIVNDHGVSEIHRAAAQKKDQSYVLFNIARCRLERILFPLGDLNDKAITRDIVQQAGLTVFDKPESQEICFAPQDDYRSVLEGRADRALMPGPILDSLGRQIGTHDGYGLFTIGQRKGIKIAAQDPLYVNAIDPAGSSITVGTRQELDSIGLKASGANWLADIPESFRCKVQIRYNNRGADAAVCRTGEKTFEVVFDAPVFAVTPGQAAVLYDGDKLLGGGWIDSAIKN
jgi:tRNA-specific 2-thiouridylase